MSDIKVAYWPCCVSRGFTTELHGSMRLVADRLGIELVELDRANCSGAGVLAERVATPPPADRLSLLIGRGRATVLRALTTPATTTGLATARGLAPSPVSQHLSALEAAGVVHRRRAGRRVLYVLEPSGTALVSLLDSGAAEFVS